MSLLQSEENVISEAPQSADSGTSGIAFEGDWEEDDLLALSGKPGNSFQKILTKSADVETPKRKLEPDLENDVTLMSNLSLSDSELDDLPTPDDDLKTSEDVSSPCSSLQLGTDAELEWDNDTPVRQNSDEISPVKQNPSIWRTVVIGEKNYKLDLSSINPYRQVLSHGGYYGEGLNAIVVFSACYLPDSRQANYNYIMDNLFLYIVSTLDLLVAEDYMIIFFNGGCSRKNFPSLKWLKKCYQMIHRRLRKNLKQLAVVHPSWYIRFIFGFFKPFISSKFRKKIQVVPSLHRLADLVSLESVVIPDAVQRYDMKLLASGKKELDSSDDTVESVQIPPNISAENSDGK